MSVSLIEILKNLLGWLKRPWQGIFLIFFVPICAVLVFLWMEREVLDELLRRNFATPALDMTKVESVSDYLLGLSDLVVVYEVSLEDNTQRSVHVNPKTEAHPPLLGMTVPFIPQGRSAGIVITELTGAIVCWNLNEVPEEEASQHIRWYQKHEYTYSCARKLPSNPGDVVGLVHMVWHKKPDRSIEYSARVAMGSRLDDMVKW